MIHVYYDTTTGMIQSVTESEYDFDSDKPHIHAEAMFNIGHYKVNLDTLELELLPVEQHPKLRDPYGFIQT